MLKNYSKIIIRNDTKGTDDAEGNVPNVARKEEKHART